MQILIIIFVKPVQLWSRLMVILSYLPFTKSKKKNNFCWLLFNFISTLYLYACNSLDLHFFYTSKVEILEISRKWTFLQLKISDSLDFTKVAETPCLLSSVVVEYSITLVKKYFSVNNDYNYHIFYSKEILIHKFLFYMNMKNV